MDVLDPLEGCSRYSLGREEEEEEEDDMEGGFCKSVVFF